MILRLVIGCFLLVFWAKSIAAEPSFVLENQVGQYNYQSCQSYALAVALAFKRDSAFPISTWRDLRDAEIAIRAEILDAATRRVGAPQKSALHVDIEQGFAAYTRGRYVATKKMLTEPELAEAVLARTGNDGSVVFPAVLGSGIKEVLVASVHSIDGNSYGEGHIIALLGVRDPLNSNRSYLVLNSGIKQANNSIRTCSVGMPDDPGPYKGGLSWVKGSRISFKGSTTQVSTWAVDRPQTASLSVPNCNMLCMERVAMTAPPVDTTALSGTLQDAQSSYDAIRKITMSAVGKQDPLTAASKALFTGTNLAAQLEVPVSAPAARILAGRIQSQVQMAMLPVESAVAAAATRDAMMIVAGALANAKSKDKALFDSFKGMSGEAAITAILERQSTLLTAPAWPKIPKEAQQPLLLAAKYEMDRLVTDVESGALKPDVKFAEAVARVAAGAEAIQSKHKQLQDTVDRISAGQAQYTEISRLISEHVPNLNVRDIEILRSMADPTKDATKKGEVLIKTFATRLDQKHRAGLESAVALYKTSPTLDMSLSDGLVAAQHLVAVGNALGLHESVTGPVNDAIAVANVGMQLAMAWGNPVAMLSVAGGLGGSFGGGSNDGAAAGRHAEVMAQFGLIRKQIEDLHREVREMRAEIRQEFFELRNDLETKHQQVMHMSQLNLQTSVSLSQAIDEFNTDDLRACLRPEKFDDWFQRSNYDWDKLVSNAAAWSPLIGRCNKGIRDRTLYGSDSAFGTTVTTFRAVTGLPEKRDDDGDKRMTVDEYKAFLSRQYQPAYRYQIETKRFHAPNGKLDEISLALLGAPIEFENQRSAVARDVKAAHAILSAESPNRFKIADATNLMGQPLSSPRLRAYAPVVRLATSLYDATDLYTAEMPRLLKTGELTQTTRLMAQADAVEHASNYLALLTAAVAQENLMVGMFGLDDMVAAIEEGLTRPVEKLPVLNEPKDGKCGGPDQYEVALCLMNSNVYITSNVALKWVLSRLKKDDVFSYRIGTTIYDTAFHLRAAIGDAPYRVYPSDAKKESRWVVHLPYKGGAFELPLPPADNVALKRYFHRPDYFDLVDEQESMRAHLAALATAVSLTEEQRMNLFQSMTAASGVDENPRLH